MSQVPVPNQTQPELAPGAPREPGPRTSPIEAEIRERLQSLEVRSQQVQERLVTLSLQHRASESNLDIVRTITGLPRMFVGARMVGPLPIPTRLPIVFESPTPENLAALDEIQTLRSEVISLAEEIRKAAIQLIMAQAIPNMVYMGQGNTVEDLLDRYGRHLTSPADLEIARRSLDAALLEKSRFEASAQSTPREFIQALGTKRNITIHGLMTLTSTPDLLGFIEDLRAPQLPPGQTLEDLREVLGSAGIPLEQSADIVREAEDFNIVINQEIDTINTRTAMWEADIVAAIDNGEFARELESFRGGISFLDNPGLYIGLPLKWMDRNYWKPMAGFGVHGVNVKGVHIPGIVEAFMAPSPIPGADKVPLAGKASSFFGITEKHYAEFEGAFAEAKASGESSWIAYGIAFEEQDSNAIGKFITEIAADPTTYFGFGITKVFKPIPLVGPALRGFEQGWVRAWDMPFIALQKGVGLVIPKLARQIADRDALRHVQVTLDYLNHSYPQAVPAQQMSMTRIRENMTIALDTLWKNPNHSGTITDSARGLLERPMLLQEEVQALASQVGRAIPAEDLQKVTSDIDLALTHSRTQPGGLSHVEGESVDLILSFLGASRTDDSIRAVSSLLRRQRQQALTRFDSIINQGNFKDFVSAIMDHRQFVLRANQANPISAYRSRMAMLMTSVSSHNRLRPAITTISATFDMLHRFSYGFTRMYLMSTLYGPYNILETVGKTVAMSINPVFRGRPLAELHRNAMGFETIMPRVFLTGEVFLPQAQDIATAGATQRGRSLGTRNAFRRIWTSKQNVLRKLYQSADEVFVQSLARVGLNQAAHVLNVLTQRHLMEGAHTGATARRVAGLTESRARSLSPHMTPQIQEMHRQEMFRLAIQDPDALATMSRDFVPGYIHAAQVQELLSKYRTLDPAIQEHLVDLAIDGDLFRLLRTNELDTRITEAIWQQIFAEPEVFLARIRELTRAVVDIPPETLEQLQVQVRMLDELNSATAHTVEQQMSATQAYTRDILNLEKKNDVWRGQWDNIIQPVMAAGEDAARQIVEALTKALREKGYNLSQHAITQYDDLIQKQLIRVQILTKAREAINDFSRLMLDERDNVVIPRIRRAGGRPNSDHPDIRDWWSRFNSGRDRIWKESQGEIAESIADTSAIAGSIDALPMPQVIDVSGRPLVMSDIAYLYGASPDAVTSGMYLADLKMMRPKAEWINLVYAQARRVAGQTGASPESVGFTKPRLALLYDQHLNSIRIRPEIENLSAPRFVEWDALHKELQAYGQSHSILLKPSATDAIDSAAKGLLEDMAADPVAREVLTTKEVRVVKEGRRHTVAELTEAGGGVEIDADRLPEFLKQRPDKSPENLARITESAAESARREESLLRRVSGKIRAVRDDLTDFSAVEEDFIEAEFGVFVPDISSAAEWDALEASARDSIEAAVSRIQRMDDQVALVSELTDSAKADAVERGIQSIGLDVPPETVIDVTDAWTPKRRAAFQDAVDEYNINFPVYDQNNAFNAGMRFLFPFWTYEAHRWSYLPRIALRNPGLTHAWGMYNDNTDRGYIPVPGMSLQANPIRNTIMMGGLQRWVNRDYPEFYDQYPEFANALDQLGRIGFYPNVYMSAFQAMPVSNKAGVWQIGEVWPAPIGSVLEAIVAADPDNVFADALAEIILPNRFRDYRVAIRMAENLPDGQGQRASEILFKRLQGEDLTDEEARIWDAAERRASIDSIMDYQIGLFRLRPEEMTQARELAKQIILRYTPLTSEQYDEMHKMGMPIEQYFPNPIELNDELRSVEEIARWRGLTTHLRESGVAQMLLKQRDFWQRVEDRRDSIREREDVLDQQFRMLGEGHIGQREWRRLKSELSGEMSRFVEDLKASPDFKDVPIEYDDRVAFAREHNTQAPIQHPIEEMVTYYFSRGPEDFRFFDPETGSMVTDWDGFYKWRSTLEDGLQGDNQDTFLSRIRRWDTDLDVVRRRDYETFIRPHKALWGLTLSEFSEDEQSVIRQFYATDSATVRAELRDVMSGNVRVVAQFQSTLSERRRRLRLLDPEIDARLAFWGETSSVASERAQAIHDGLYTQYGIQEREVIPIETPVRNPALDN